MVKEVVPVFVTAGVGVVGGVVDVLEVAGVLDDSVLVGSVLVGGVLAGSVPEVAGSVLVVGGVFVVEVVLVFLVLVVKSAGDEAVGTGDEVVDIGGEFVGIGDEVADIGGEVVGTGVFGVLVLFVSLLTLLSACWDSVVGNSLGLKL